MTVDELIAHLQKLPPKIHQYRVAVAAPTEAVFVDFLDHISVAALQDPDEPGEPPQDVVVLWPTFRPEDRTEKR